MSCFDSLGRNSPSLCDGETFSEATLATSTSIGTNRGCRIETLMTSSHVETGQRLQKKHHKV